LAKHLKKNREIFDENFLTKNLKKNAKKNFRFRGILILIMSKKINISIFWDFWQIEFLDKNSTF